MRFYLRKWNLDLSKNTIVISKDLETAQNEILKEIGGLNHRIFTADEFKVDNVKEVIREAYIAETETKYLLLIAKNYNIYAQNALLKILEEPPKNIVFILVAPSKTIFLPTIRSRMPIKTIQTQKEEIELNLPLDKLSLKETFSFLQEHRYTKKSELKEIISTLLKDALLKYNLKLTEEELYEFEKALSLCELNTRGLVLLSDLILTLALREKR